jgi:hypothetical protein
MLSHNPIFSQKFFEEEKPKIEFFLNQIKDLAIKISTLEDWYAQIKSGKVGLRNEKQQQSEFLDTVFGQVLDYAKTPSDWKLEKELTLADGAIPDGLLGFFDTHQRKDIRVIIELKGLRVHLDKPQMQRKDNFTPVQQGFSYLPPIGEKCQWVIISNFDEIRLYHRSDSHRYESFLFSELLAKNPQEKAIAKQYPNLPKFFYLLHFGQLFNALEQNTEAAIPLTEKLYKGRIKRLEEITNQFYQSYRKLKEKLQTHIQTQNKNLKLSPYQSFQLAHQVFNKLIFIRFAEEIELANKKSIYDFWTFLKVAPTREPLVWYALRSIFTSFDEGYNSQIPPFNGELFKPVPLLAKITIENEILREILNFLLSYDFKNELKVDILGHIFEQSINDIAAAKASETEENFTFARKKDGVFYTPEYVTDYMIRETVIAYLNEQKQLIFKKLNIDFISEFEIDFQRWQAQNLDLTRKQANEIYATFFADYQQVLENIKILDPACGSGAFLTRTYDILLKEWEIVYDESKKSSENLYEIFVNEPKTQAQGKKKTQSTDMFNEAEVAKKKRSKDLFQIGKNILLNNLFGVDLSAEAVEITKLSLWLKTANNQNVTLANLENNIKQGNSLIEDKSIDENAFVWEKEFPEIFVFSPSALEKDGVKQEKGFDVVIGNPPYVDIKNLPPDLVKQYFKNFVTAENRINLYSLFIERVLTKFLKSKSYFSFIIPNSLLNNSSYSKIRETLFHGIKKVVKLPDNVFEDANVETIIFVYEQSQSFKNCEVVIYPRTAKIEVIEETNLKLVDKSNWNGNHLTFNIYTDNQIQSLLKKLYDKAVPLSEICDFSLGITPYDKYRGHSESLIENRDFHADNPLDTTYKPLIAGENITRFLVSDKVKEYIKYGAWLGAMREERFFTNPRIVVRQIVSGKPPRIYAGFTDKPLYFTQIGFSLLLKDSVDYHLFYLLALINSKLFTFMHKYKFLDLEKEIFQKILIENCKQFPIKNIPLAQQQPLINKVQEILSLNPIIDSDKFQTIDNEIDKLVYKLYELNEEEIKQVESVKI